MASPLHLCKLLVPLMLSLCGSSVVFSKLPDAVFFSWSFIRKMWKYHIPVCSQNYIVLVIWFLPKEHCRSTIALWTQTITWDVSPFRKCKSGLGNKVASWHRPEAFWSSLQFPENGTSAVSLSLLVYHTSSMKVNYIARLRMLILGKQEVIFRMGERGMKQPLLEACVIALFMYYFSPWVRAGHRMYSLWKRQLLAWVAGPSLSSSDRLPESQWQCSQVCNTGLEQPSFAMGPRLGMWDHHSHCGSLGLAEPPRCLLSQALLDSSQDSGLWTRLASCQEPWIFIVT